MGILEAREILGKVEFNDNQLRNFLRENNRKHASRQKIVDKIVSGEAKNTCSNPQCVGLRARV